jgi:hypothetical protein
VYFPSYFPTYFPSYFPKGVAEVASAPSGVRGKGGGVRRVIWLTDDDFPEAPPELTTAVKRFIRRAVVKVQEATPKPVPEQVRGALTEVVRGVYLRPGAIDTFDPAIAWLLHESIKAVAGGSVLNTVAKQVAAKLQKITDEEEEEFLLALLLSDIEIY